MKPLHSLAILLASITAAHGTPTGLNNIPTADTVPHRTVAVQAFSSFGGANQFSTSGAGKHSYWMGFKAGCELSPLRLEFGLDSPLGTGLTGPLFLQVKAGVSLREGGSLALGVAGIPLTDTGRAGDPFTYAVLAHDFGLVRAHSGYGLQTNGNSFLVGVDRTWEVLGRNYNLNADLVQSRNQRGLVTAVGAKCDLTDHIVLESWANFPDRDSVSVIAKTNFVFKF